MKLAASKVYIASLGNELQRGENVNDRRLWRYEILSKKESRERERELERFVALFVVRQVNLALRDGSLIVNVILVPLNGKHFLGYRAFPADKIGYLPLFDIDALRKRWGFKKKQLCQTFPKGCLNCFNPHCSESKTGRL